MIPITGELYLWVKAIHLIAVIAWMAGLLYLPRLYVYHCEATPGGELDAKLRVMENRLLRVIMNPAMIAVWVLGLALWFSPVVPLTAGWMHAKFALVIAMTGMHGMMARWRKAFASGTNSRSQRFYRLMNEVPTVLMIAIVILVIVQPF